MKANYKETRIERLEELTIEVRKDRAAWKSQTFPWFRGESECPTNYHDGRPSPLLPELYRYKDGTCYENRLLQNFRMEAPIRTPMLIPPRNNTDQWLFLARHVGLPTRLLDWTEGLLIALYFALHTREEGAVVWMLDPYRLNLLSAKEPKDDPYNPCDRIGILRENIRPLTWTGETNIGNLNIRGAWETDRVGTPAPVAIFPTYAHPRMSAQLSCFTIHGTKKGSLLNLVPEVDPPLLYRYVIDRTQIEFMKRDLRVLGIRQSSLIPELDGLATDLVESFLPKRLACPDRAEVPHRSPSR